MKQVDRYVVIGWLIGFVVTSMMWYGIVTLIKGWL